MDTLDLLSMKQDRVYENVKVKRFRSSASDSYYKSRLLSLSLFFASDSLKIKVEKGLAGSDVTNVDGTFIIPCYSAKTRTIVLFFEKTQSLKHLILGVEISQFITMRLKFQNDEDYNSAFNFFVYWEANLGKVEEMHTTISLSQYRFNREPLKTPGESPCTYVNNTHDCQDKETFGKSFGNVKVKRFNPSDVHYQFISLNVCLIFNNIYISCIRTDPMTSGHMGEDCTRVRGTYSLSYEAEARQVTIMFQKMQKLMHVPLDVEIDKYNIIQLTLQNDEDYESAISYLKYWETNLCDRESDSD